MKKLYSLIKATMTSDMNLFTVKQKKKNKKNGKSLIIVLSLVIMFTMWTYGNIILEVMAPLHLEHVVLSLAVFVTSFMTIIEGIYKSGPILFNCKDDQLLLSLPIKRGTVLFVRILKFYIFELLFNSLFLVPLMLSYVGWAKNIDWTFFLSGIVMVILLPVIPIVISCIIGSISIGISSRFKYKNLVQIIISMIFLSGTMYLSLNTERVLNYLSNHADNVNSIITKIYYPAGVYGKLVTNFNIMDLLVFILINIVLSVLTIFILSKIYFKINSRLKKGTISKKKNLDDLSIKSTSKTKSLIKKELKTFFNIPVFIINAGLGLFLFIIISIAIAVKFDSVIPMIEKMNMGSVLKDMFLGNKTVLILILITFTSFMTSITNSVISLEGRNINILKSLPIDTKEILLSKLYAALVITTPLLLVGDLILFIRFKISIIDSLLLIILSILLPLVSHFIGLIVNLKYPKLDAENSAEVVKQSTSSFISVMTGMGLLVVNIIVISILTFKLSPTIISIIFVIIYSLVDYILYLYLTKKSIKDFNELSV
ncbi:MAG: hypothetical protein IJI43_00140 [Bacilli bacterium]|nr:hypothetical protein [Bacilli bacterium]